MVIVFLLIIMFASAGKRNTLDNYHSQPPQSYRDKLDQLEYEEEMRKYDAKMALTHHLGQYVLG